MTARYGTWRVVTPGGHTLDAPVFRRSCDCGCKLSPTWVQIDGGTTYGIDRDGEATIRAIYQKIGEVIACAEIRAPGELTTAEQIAARSP